MCCLSLVLVRLCDQQPLDGIGFELGATEDAFCLSMGLFAWIGWWRCGFGNGVEHLSPCDAICITVHWMRWRVMRRWMPHSSLMVSIVAFGPGS